jgi:hypothetical protein
MTETQDRCINCGKEITLVKSLVKGWIWEHITPEDDKFCTLPEPEGGVRRGESPLKKFGKVMK